jgi:hypothetical protein
MTVKEVRRSVERRLKNPYELGMQGKGNDKRLLKYLRKRCKDFRIQFTEKEDSIRDLAPRVAKEIMSHPDDSFWEIKEAYWKTHFPLHHRKKVLTH